MSELDRFLDQTREHQGVEHVFLLGADGLLVRYAGDGEVDAETVAAMVPGVANGAAELARSAGWNGFSSAVMELGEGVGVVVRLSDDLLMAVLLRAGVGFAPLLHDLRANRERIAGMV
ncbi:MAG: roadblock/LC7 domain-containing protein [Longimicrobiaceae bacterium]